MSFSFAQFGPVSAVVYDQWQARGITHGFTLAPADFGVNGVDRWGHELSVACGEKPLALLHQVHGDLCCEVSTELFAPGAPLEGDAFAWNRECDFHGIFGVKAADCVPILGYSEHHRFAIHAGWRGLAAGIIARVLSLDGAAECEWVIGPCAGPDRYEVGPEVLKAIGVTAVVRTNANHRFEIDLARTAERLIGISAPNARVAVIGLNTLLDKRFHSHRRDGAQAGRGLGFFVV